MSSCNGPERGQLPAPVTHCCRVSGPSKPGASLPQGLGLGILLISMISGGKKALAGDQTQMGRRESSSRKAGPVLSAKPSVGEGAGSVEMVSAATGQIKRQRQDCDL